MIEKDITAGADPEIWETPVLMEVGVISDAEVGVGVNDDGLGSSS